MSHKNVSQAFCSAQKFKFNTRGAQDVQMQHVHRKSKSDNYCKQCIGKSATYDHV